MVAVVLVGGLGHPVEQQHPVLVRWQGLLVMKRLPQGFPRQGLDQIPELSVHGVGLGQNLARRLLLMQIVEHGVDGVGFSRLVRFPVQPHHLVRRLVLEHRHDFELPAGDIGNHVLDRPAERAGNLVQRRVRRVDRGPKRRPLLVNRRHQRRFGCRLRHSSGFLLHLAVRPLVAHACMILRWPGAMVDEGNRFDGPARLPNMTHPTARRDTSLENAPGKIPRGTVVRSAS
jgi:hypothetical protein